MIVTQINAASSSTLNGAFSTNIVEMPGSKTRVLITENVSVWSESVKNQLQELIRLPFGWDGYNGIPVSFENATFTLRMLEAICGLETPPPQIVPGTIGDLQAEWHTLKGDIELYVRAPNNVYAWRAMSDGDSDGEELELTTNFIAIAQWIKELMEPPIATAAAAA